MHELTGSSETGQTACVSLTGIQDHCQFLQTGLPQEHIKPIIVKLV